MKPAATLGEALAWARGHVCATEARLLLREASGERETTLIAFPERALTPAATLCFRDWVIRRAAGEPVAYLLGRREFYGRDFAVGPEVLIPRHETELLVDLALAQLTERRAPRLLDLGTGSGAIAISLALERPDAEVWAVERSAPAAVLAHANAQRLGARLRVLQGDWYAPLAGERFDLIVSNPPYIEPDDAHLTQGDLRFEPRTALVAPDDGLADLAQIIAGASAHLLSGAWLLCEHGWNQSERVRALMARAGLQAPRSWRDLAGIDRVSGACA